MITELKIKNKLLLVIFMLLLKDITATERWSRQLQSSGFQTATSAGNDWIPLTQPSSTFRSTENVVSAGQNDRTGNGRVLNFQPHPHHQPPFAPHIFTSNGNVQHQPPPQFALVHGEPFSLLGQRFVLPPPQQQQQQQQQQLGPISQFQQVQPQQVSLPQYQMQKINQQQQSQIKQQTFANQQQYQVVGQQVQQPQQQQKLQQQQLHIQPPRQQQVQYQTLQVQQPQQIVSSYPKEQTAQQFVEEQLAARQKPNFIDKNLAQPVAQVESLIQSQPILHYSEQQTINKNNHQQLQQNQLNKPSQNNQQQPDEEVQLLYVPLDALYQQKNQQGFQGGKYNVLQQLNPAHINDFYTQLPPSTAIPTTTSTTTTTTTASPLNQVSSSRGNYYHGPEITTSTSKPKAHQPPLAMYMFNEKESADSSVNDVLTTLRQTKTISVLDSLSSQTSPKVFVGPSGLKTPDGYSKFDLPYLSSIDHNRFERRVENLPFFVAPLSYRAPEGFEKIPLPAPHVGSVIVNIPSNTIESDDKQSYKHSSFISSTKKPAFLPREEQQPQFIAPVTQNYQNYFPDTSPVNNLNVNHEQFTTGAPREYITTPSQVYNSFSPTYETHSTFKPQSKFEQYDIEEERPTVKTFPQRNTSRSHIRQRLPQSQKSFSTLNTQVVNEEYFNVQKPQENSFIQQQDSITEIPSQPFSHKPELLHTKFEAQQKNPIESYVPVPSTTNYDDFGLSTAISSLKWAEQSTASPKRGNHIAKVQEEQRMKTYFRDQPAFRNRQGISSTTTTTQFSPSSYEQISYSTTPSYLHSTTPSSLNYHQSEEFAPIVSSQAPIQTPTEYSFNNEQSTRKTNFYEPFNQQQTKEEHSFRTHEPHRINSNQNIEQTQSVHKFKFVDSVRPGYSHSTTVTPTTTEQQVNYYGTQDKYKNVNYATHNSEQDNDADKKTINKYKYNLNSDQIDYSVKPLLASTVTPMTSPITEQSTYNYPQEETYYQTAQYVEYNREPNQKQTIQKSSVYSTHQETGHEENKENVENVYEKNPYHLPSELPPLNANLPGLVNSLMELDKTEEEIPTTTTTRTVISRRPLNRGRRPPPTRASTSTTETTTTRRLLQRGRRPLITRPINTENYSDNITSTTSQATPSRSAIVRNPNRIRYNPTTEERRSYRPRSRNNNGLKNKEEENLEYQRDVLKQNYPVIKTTVQTTTDLPAIDTTIINNYSENLNNQHYNSQYDTYYQETRDQQPVVNNNEYATSENNFKKSQEEITTLTPSTNTEYILNSQKEHFVGLNEPMQVPQEYYKTNNDQVEEINEQQDSYPTYYQDSQKVSNGNKITTSGRPVYVQNTTPVPVTTTLEPFKFRRPGPGFVRRPGRPLNPTIAPTTHATTTTNSDSFNQDKYTIRSKSRLDAAQRQTRIRGRMRKPTTTTEEPEEINTTNSYYQRNRYQEDYFTESPKNEEFKITVAPYEERTQHSRFRLEGQESQWSTKLTQNSFRPLDLDIRGKSLKNIESVEEEKEPEIITAGYEELDTFTVNITPGKKTLFDDNANGLFIIKNKTEVTLDEIVDQMTSTVEDKLSKNSNEIIEQLKNENKLEDNKETSRRRGIWRRVRVRPIDQFEAAESQNIGQHFFNSVLNENTNKNLNNKNFLNNKPNKNIIFDTTNEKTSDDKNTEIEISPEITTVPSVNNSDDSSEASPVTVVENSTEYLLTTTNNPDKEDEIITTMSPNMNDENELHEESESTTVVVESENEMKEVNDEAGMTLTTQPPIMEYDYSESETTTENSEDIKSASEDSSSMFDEVKQKLVDLFFSNDSDDEFDYHEVGPMAKQEYTSIDRSKLLNEDDTIQTTTELPEVASITETSVSPKDPMGSLILATSTSKEISHETEICYRGRCVKTDMKKKID